MIATAAAGAAAEGAVVGVRRAMRAVRRLAAEEMRLVRFRCFVRTVL
jgi:hypothetical protein